MDVPKVLPFPSMSKKPGLLNWILFTVIQLFKEVFENFLWQQRLISLQVFSSWILTFSISNCCSSKISLYENEGKSHTINSQGTVMWF